MKSPKDIVREFYNSDFAKDPEAHKRFLHPEYKLHWHSSRGFSEFNFQNISILFEDIVKSYSSFRIQLSHLLEDDDNVIARYTIYVCPIESPEEESPMAHFITIWQVKDGKLYRGHEISQLADESPESLNSFSEIKV